MNIPAVKRELEKVTYRMNHPKSWTQYNDAVDRYYTLKRLLREVEEEVQQKA